MWFWLFQIQSRKPQCFTIWCVLYFPASVSGFALFSRDTSATTFSLDELGLYEPELDPEFSTRTSTAMDFSAAKPESGVKGSHEDRLEVKTFLTGLVVQFALQSHMSDELNIAHLIRD